MREVITFDADVENFNTKPRPEYRIYVSATSKSLTEEEGKVYFSLIEILTRKIQDQKDLQSSNRLLLERAIAYAETQDQDAAISDLTAYIQLDSISPLGYWQRAVCMAMKNEYSASQGIDVQLMKASALDDFAEALKRSPRNAYLYYDRATFHAHSKDYTQAFADFAQAIQLDPNLAEAYYNRGLCYLYTGETEKANKDLSKAGELGLYNAYSILKKQQKTK